MDEPRSVTLFFLQHMTVYPTVDRPHVGCSVVVPRLMSFSGDSMRNVTRCNLFHIIITMQSTHRLGSGLGMLLTC